MRRSGKGCATLLVALSLLSGACGREQAPAASGSAHSGGRIVACTMEDDKLSQVFPEFTAEFGVKVEKLGLETPEAVAQAIRNGRGCDVAVVEDPLVPALVGAGLLAEIELRNVPNSKYISANFRGRAIDPEGRYAVPYTFGTTGLLVRTDLVNRPVRHWADLWDPRYAGKIAVRRQVRELMAIALLSLGYRPESEQPAEMEQALERLRDLRRSASFVGPEPAEAVPRLLSGEMVILQGWAEDYRVARRATDKVSYVLPAEGALLWADNFVIPASSPRRVAAQRLIDFALRPQVSGRIVNENSYASANDAARPYVEPQLLGDPVIYPAPPGPAPGPFLRSPEPSRSAPQRSCLRALFGLAGGDIPMRYRGVSGRLAHEPSCRSAHRG
jgi:spermidine/putrescine transport system substrate-binding protein